ncbi:DNA-directed DNA polymerase II small subunit [archaeon]|jgi:DNA polymerase II small subunit|nr:DNA-directed DNA polymerase II small subunit [archaeon]
MESTNSKLVNQLFEQGVLISKEILESNINDDLISKIEFEQDLLVMNEDVLKIVSGNETLIDWYEFDEHRVSFEKNHNPELYESHLQNLQNVSLSFPNTNLEVQKIKSNLQELEENVVTSSSKIEVSNQNQVISSINNSSENLNFEIITSFKSNSHKHKIVDFSRVFLSRYKFLQSLISQRPEMENLTSISRLKNKKEREKLSIIGLVYDSYETRNGHIILTIEDPTGHIKVLINNKNKKLLLEAKELIFDEVIGIYGSTGDNIIFADKIVWPDVPLTNDLKKSSDEDYAIFLSDIHIGSTYFLEKEFEKFIRWVSGKAGNESQRKISSKVKYIFIAGDIVDGIGIYPLQEEELNIKTMKGQYDKFTELIKKIPSDKQIFICPGNHDLVHLAEPQPVFYKEYTQELHDMKNVTLVSNPSMINIAKKEGFEGFNILMYHGYSFDYYVANVDSIRNKGGYHRADLIMQFLLKRRHLAPTFTSTPYLPSYQTDPLLITKIPDIMITGHIHYSAVSNYRGVTLMSGSCWQAKTKFQEKLGHDPEPGRVPLVNLKTREVKILKFA